MNDPAPFPPSTEAGVVAALAAAAATPEPQVIEKNIDGRTVMFIVKPDGTHEEIDFDDLTARDKVDPDPRDVAVSITVATPQAFVEAVRLHQLEDKAAIVEFKHPDLGSASVTGVLDPSVGSQLGAAKRIVKLQHTLHPRFVAWERFAGRFHPIKEFGSFLLDHIRDIVQPDEGTIRDIARGVDIDTAGQVTSTHDQSTGSTSLRLEHRAQIRTGDLRLLTIDVPIFLGMPSEQITLEVDTDTETGGETLVVRKVRMPDLTVDLMPHQVDAIQTVIRDGLASDENLKVDYVSAVAS